MKNMEPENITEVIDMLNHAIESRNWGFVEEAIEVLNEYLGEDFPMEEEDED